jgi:formate dehydrogenase maturation protein FdhE
MRFTMISYPEIAKALEQGAEKHPELADTVRLYRALLEIQDQAQVQPYQASLTVAEAHARLEQGLPLMSPDELDADPAGLAELCARIGFAIAEQKRERVNALAQIHAWLYERRHQIGALAVEYLRSGRVPGSDRAEIDRDLLAFVFDSGLRPFLRAQAEALAPLVDDAGWYRGCCPVCGGEPDMAALGKGNGRRRLFCSRCDCEWTFRRLGCPFCGNDDPGQLAHYPSEDNVYRLSVCEQCRRYLKIIDLREVTGEHPLAAERILTAGMDAAAEGMSYR